jgi:hypothetical protein
MTEGVDLVVGVDAKGGVSDVMAFRKELACHFGGSALHKRCTTLAVDTINWDFGGD